MSLVSFWPRLRHLFENDDGSLPDIFIDGISPQDSVDLYEWLVSQCKVPSKAMLWSNEKQRDVLISEVAHPARAFLLGRVGSFQHGLEGLLVGGVELPTLSVSVESEGMVLDYRMGSEWGEWTLRALMELLRQILIIMPHAQILQADESSYAYPSVEFSEALHDYVEGIHGVRE